MTRDLKKDPIRLGILGCGSFAQRRILPIIKEVESIRLVSVQKRDIKAAQDLANHYGVPYAVATREELLVQPDVEAVFICTPNHCHEEDAIACAQAGKATLCEKPLGISTEGVQRMLDAFKAASVPFLAAHCMRFRPSIQTAKQMLASGALGVLKGIRAHFSIPTIGEALRLRVKPGNGSLFDLGVHLIYLLHFISGQQIVSVYAQANSDWTHDGLEVDRTVSALCRLADGAQAEFTCSLEQPFYSGFEVIGSESRLVSTHSLRQTYDPIESLCHIQKDDSKLFLPVKKTLHTAASQSLHQTHLPPAYVLQGQA